MQNPIRDGREHYASAAWDAAYNALAAADAQCSLEPADLERFATCAYLTGRDAEFQQLHERLHRVRHDAQDPAGAARSAFWLSLTSLFRGETGQANAWIARGQRLIRDRDVVERGYLLLPVAEQHLNEGALEAAAMSCAEAVAAGEHFGDADLESVARHVEGRVLIRQGHIAAGLARLDEAMLAVVAGELSPIVTGLMYCSVIEACRLVYAHDRAQEWTAAFSRLCKRQPEMIAFTGTCHVHRAEIMQFHGAWPDSFAEAGRACQRSERAAARPLAAARYQQAEIHRLRGEFPKAEEAYRAASQLGCEPHPGLALLWLAQGRTEAACAAIQRMLVATGDRLGRARLLPACIEILIESDKLREAKDACAELQELAEAFGTDVLHGLAAQARGSALLAEGDTRAAIPQLRQALAIWDRLGAPYDSARVRMLIGLSCRTMDDDESACLEFEAAAAAFEKLGARGDLDRLGALMRSDFRNRKSPLTAREIDVLRLIAAGKTNKAIAAALSLSERTIDRHVSNILGKLDVPSRSAATAYACDHKLL